MDQLRQYLKRKNVLLASGIVLGALLILGIRFVTYSPPEENHYHANFAVFLNGQRESFKEPRYFEEVAICSQGDSNPAQRVHMHNQDGAAVHVHDSAVTWGHFFNNLSWNIGKDFIVDGNGTLYQDNEANKLSVYINGQDFTGLTSITNKVIQSKDRLLISYGPEDQITLQERVKVVPSTAADYNSKPDPSTCAGEDETTLSDRFKNLL